VTTWSDREFDSTVTRRIGSEVAVWYDPGRPARCEVAFSADYQVSPLEVVLAGGTLLIGLLVVAMSAGSLWDVLGRPAPDGSRATGGAQPAGATPLDDRPGRMVVPSL
jgi:hypothetical protein